MNESEPVYYQCPRKTASFLSRFTYTWTSSLMKLGVKRSLKVDDIWSPVEEDEAKHNIDIFNRLLINILT
jgi:hypothetical protein